MAQHKFDGEWTYFEAPVGQPPRRDEKMKLVIPENGTVDDTQSKHKGKKLKGNATDKTITLYRGEPQDKRDYFGVLLFDMLGSEQMVIVGNWKNNPEPGPEPQIAALAQNEGTWIITKP